MNNKQAMNRLEKHLEYGWSEQTVEAINMGIHSLKVSQWIPCGERMPYEHTTIFPKNKKHTGLKDKMFEKISDYVIVTIACEDGHTFVKQDLTVGGVWEYEKDHIFGGKVVAWMPLPEPYKGE